MEERVFLDNRQIEVHQPNARYAVARHSVGSLIGSCKVSGTSPLIRDCEIVRVEIVEPSIPVDGLGRTNSITLYRRRHLLRAHQHRIAGSGRTGDIVDGRVTRQTCPNVEKLTSVPRENGIQSPTSRQRLWTGRPSLGKRQLPTSA